MDQQVSIANKITQPYTTNNRQTDVTDHLIYHRVKITNQN